MRHELKTDYVLCKTCDKYYYGWQGFDMEFNNVEELEKFVDSIDFYPLKFSIRKVLSEGIPELNLSKRPSVVNGFDSLVEVTTSLRLLKKLYTNDWSVSKVLQNQYCPTDILVKEAEVLHPNKGNAPWLLRNNNLPYSIVNRFTVEVLRYFHESYYKYLLKNHSAKYDYVNHKELIRLQKTGKSKSYNCPNCSGNKETDYNCNTESINQLPNEVGQEEKCPHCGTVMVEWVRSER